jgi:hypothetical protein
MALSAAYTSIYMYIHLEPRSIHIYIIHKRFYAIRHIYFSITAQFLSYVLKNPIVILLKSIKVIKLKYIYRMFTLKCNPNNNHIVLYRRELEAVPPVKQTFLVTFQSMSPLFLGSRCRTEALKMRVRYVHKQNVCSFPNISEHRNLLLLSPKYVTMHTLTYSSHL